MRLSRHLDEHDVPRDALALAVMLVYFTSECSALGMDLLDVQQLLLQLKNLVNPGQQTGEYRAGPADVQEMKRIARVISRYFAELPSAAGMYLVALKDLALLLATTLGEPAIKGLHEVVTIVPIPDEKVH